MTDLIRILLMLTLFASAAGCDAEAEYAADASLDDFAGLWQVVPRPPPFFERGAGQDSAGRPLGFDADENGLTRSDHLIRLLMTSEGRGAFDGFDPDLLPANNCLSPGLPSIVMTPYLQEWSVEEDLTITHEYFSTVRTVNMQVSEENRGLPGDLEHTPAGYAAGYLENGELVIRTTALAPIWGGLSRNAPASDAREIEERYRLTPDGRSMHGVMVIEDPKYLRRQIELEVTLERTAPGIELHLFPCDLEASRRHLD